MIVSSAGKSFLSLNAASHTIPPPPDLLCFLSLSLSPGSRGVSLVKQLIHTPDTGTENTDIRLGFSQNLGYRNDEISVYKANGEMNGLKLRHFGSP
jgi:hypothetical protein